MSSHSQWVPKCGEQRGPKLSILDSFDSADESLLLLNWELLGWNIPVTILSRLLTIVIVREWAETASSTRALALLFLLDSDIVDYEVAAESQGPEDGGDNLTDKREEGVHNAHEKASLLLHRLFPSIII